MEYPFYQQALDHCAERKMKMQIPRLKTIDGKVRLMVDGAPYFILGMQLDCDSCYDADNMAGLMAQAKRMGCNSVALLLYWRLIEPEMGQYDFTILDAMIAAAEKCDLRIVLVWFGSYKNGCLQYAPDWVRSDQDRFQRAWRRDGTRLEPFACPTCKETLVADRDAVCQVFTRLKERDVSRRVILFQVNNEIGLLTTDRCYCPRCQERYDAGAYDAQASGAAAFSADCFLAFQETIAAAAKAIYPLPCYLNAWLSGTSPSSRPGQYPAGGPEPRVLAQYLREKRAIDFVSPDVYSTGQAAFHRLCALYDAPGNPLYIAEHSAGKGSRMEKNVFYTLAYGAIGFDPWAIDSAFPDQNGQPLVDNRTFRWSDEAYDLADSYIPLSDAMPLVAAHAGTGALQAFVQEDGEWGAALCFGDVYVDIGFESKKGDSRGCVIRLEKDVFAVIGCKANVSFVRPDGTRRAVKRCERGTFCADGGFLAHRLNRREGIDNTRAVRMPQPGAYRILLEADPC